MLSWAFTIHKSQGSNLNKAIIDLGKAEECSEIAFIREQFPLMVIDLGKAEKCIEMT